MSQLKQAFVMPWLVTSCIQPWPVIQNRTALLINITAYIFIFFIASKCVPVRFSPMFSDWRFLMSYSGVYYDLWVCWPSQFMFFVSPDSPVLFFTGVIWTQYSWSDLSLFLYATLLWSQGINAIYNPIINCTFSCMFLDIITINFHSLLCKFSHLNVNDSLVQTWKRELSSVKWHCFLCLLGL